MLSIAGLIRKLVAIEFTDIGKDFIATAKALEKEMPEIKTGIIKTERKADACDILSKAYLNFIKKATGHGLAKDKADEMIKTINSMQTRNDFKGLVAYPYNFALAWKHKVIKEAETLHPHMTNK